MALYLTNIAQMHARNSFANISGQLNTSMQRLNSGMRINSAKDDPAGLQISNRLNSQILGLRQASRNVSDGIALFQTAEGALDEVTTMLQRIRTLAVQSSNGTLSSADRDAINQEVGQLSEEINRIAKTTKFGGSTIFNGDGKTPSLKNANDKIIIQVGSYQGDTIEVDMSKGMFLDDMAKAAKLDANKDTGFVTNADAGRFDVSTQENAENVLSFIDSFLSHTNSTRAYFGAIENRLDSVNRLNSTMTMNLADAKARISDTDYAQEVSNYAALQVKQQISLQIMTMAGKANQNLILQLLQGI